MRSLSHVGTPGLLTLGALSLVSSGCVDAGGHGDLASEERAVGRGIDWNNPAYVAVSWPPSGGGSGSFAEVKRCVLTAGHTAKSLAAAGRGAVLSSNLNGVRIDDQRVAYDFVKPGNIKVLQDELPAPENDTKKQFNDIAWIWTDATKAPWGKRPAIHDAKNGQPYTPRTIDFATVPDIGARYDVDDGTILFSVAYGKECVNGSSGGIQRYGYFNPTILYHQTTRDLDGLQNRDFFAAMKVYGRKLLGQEVRFRYCEGDSGSAVETYSPEKIIGVQFGVHADDNYVGMVTLVKPYQPWMQKVIDKWCHPMNKVAVHNDSPSYQVKDITGVATTDAMTGTIITCNGTTNDCTQGCGGLFPCSMTDRYTGAESDWLPGEGTVTLTAHDIPGFCFLGWKAGGGCPCEGWIPGQPFPSHTCTINLRDKLHPDPEVTEDVPLQCFFRYAPTSFPMPPYSYPNPVCGGGAICGDGMCTAGESCTYAPYGYVCGNVDCGDCDGFCGDRFCDASEAGSCSDCTCGDEICQTHETCSNCSYDCGSCIHCGNGTCDLGEQGFCVEDCGGSSPCGDGMCGPFENCDTCVMDCGSCESGACGDGLCDPAGEDCQTCAADCGQCGVCGDELCDVATEGCEVCAEDCGPCGCGDGVCDPTGEDCESCWLDCGSC